LNFISRCFANPPPPRANDTNHLLKKYTCELFDHPPYSPELAPSDFHLFRELKAWLGGQRFAANDELQDAVKTYLSSLAANFVAEASRSLCHFVYFRVYSDSRCTSTIPNASMLYQGISTEKSNINFHTIFIPKSNFIHHLYLKINLF
jgi:hypothetical protein